MADPVICRISGLDNEVNDVIRDLKKGILALVLKKTGIERVHFSFPQDIMDSEDEVPICMVSCPEFINPQKSSLKEEIENLFMEIMRVEAVVRVNNC